MNIGTLHLHRLKDVTADGQVRLDGTNVRILLAGRVTDRDVGRFAVCQRVEIDDAPAVIVLGLLEENTEPRDDDPLELNHGAASLKLHSDGRIEIKGEAITVDSATQLSLLAARIDLN